MIGSILSGAMKIGSSIFGGIKASKEAKKQEKMIQQQKQENEAWYNRRYNEDATQRADAQRMLTYVQDTIKSQNRQASATAAVAGGTAASVAAQKAANNSIVANAASTINAQANARKDAIEQQYQNNKDALTNKQIELSQNKANAITQAVEGVSDAASGIFSAIPALNKTTQATTTQQ